MTYEPGGSVSAESPEDVHATPEPCDFQAPRPPGAGALLLFTAGFLFFQFFLLALGMLVRLALPAFSTGFLEILLMMSATLLWGLAAWFWVKVRNLPPQWLALRPPVVRAWFWPVLLLAVPATLNFGSHLDMLVMSLFPRALAPDTTLERLSDIASGSMMGQLLVALLAVVAAPLCEELFFRGLALRSLRMRRWSFFGAAAFSSLLFAGIHFKLTGFLLLFTVAMVLSMLAEKTKSLLPSVVFHAAYNAFVLGVSLWKMAQDPAMHPFSMNPPSAPAIPLPPVTTILAGFVNALPMFGILMALLYFGAFPPVRKEAKES